MRINLTRSTRVLAGAVVAGATLALVLITVPAAAPDRRGLSNTALTDLTQSATFIMRARVLQSRIAVEQIGRERIPLQIANILPSRVFKGNVRSSTIEVRATTSVESPDIRQGEDVILFLFVWRPAEGREYLTPLGIGGKFSIVEDPRYGPIVLNDIELGEWRRTGGVTLTESRPLRLKEFLAQLQRELKR